MAKSISAIVAFGLLTMILPASAFAQDRQAKCNAYCQRTCTAANIKSQCVSTCMSKCMYSK